MRPMRAAGMTAARCVVAAVVLCATPLSAHARVARTELTDLKHLSIHQLMDIQITSVSRTGQPILSTPAAVSVLTQVDLRRSGVTTLAEALRLVPGVIVARINASHWAVTQRFSNDVFGQTILVLIDGRTVTDPTTSLVHWDELDIPLDDVERIEVTRGPGASVWGTNAVNGVVSVVTFSAQQTQGGLATASLGSVENGRAHVRYGDKLGDGLHVRGYAKYNDRDNNTLSSGAPANDQWQNDRFGLRADWAKSKSEDVTFWADGFDSTSKLDRVASSLAPPFLLQVADDSTARGGDVMMRYIRRHNPQLESSLQISYDQETRVENGQTADRAMTDVDFQQSHKFGDSGDLVWGLGYRHIHSATFSNSIASVALNPLDRDFDLYSAFVQRRFLFDQRWELTIGTKLEENYFTGLEVEPTLRLRWSPDPKQVIWAALSRAVRLPTLLENDSSIRFGVVPPQFPTNVVTVLQAIPNGNFKSEELLATELGYRRYLSARASLDLALFYNDYKNLQSVQTLIPVFQPFPPPARLTIPFQFQNRVFGQSFGYELALSWSPTDHLRVKAWVSTLDLGFGQTPGTTGGDTVLRAGRSPAHQAHFGLSWDPLPGVEVDPLLYWVESLPALGVPGYVRFDLRVAYNIDPRTTVSVVGQNVFDDRHPEFDPSYRAYPEVEIRRNIFGTIARKF